MFVLSPHLFISYSRQDTRFVDNLVTSLRKRGFDVFRDTSDISPGDNFVSTIAKEIRRATGWSRSYLTATR
jgi:TIR domain